MKRSSSSPAPWFLARRAPETYCRRDNRIYESCPHAASCPTCPCLHEVETADSLFEPNGTDEEHKF
jgi:hypothetical protein